MSAAGELLSLRDLRFAWNRTDTPLIELERFSLAAGERVFISGASGCGKSSLLSLISGVVQPRSGSIDILGERITEMPGVTRDKFRADHLGVVFQLFNLVPYLSIMENVLLPCLFSGERRKRIDDNGLAPEREAARLLDKLELDFRRHGRQPVVTLSIGQQQRVALARALIGSPALIIADEPTSALDDAASQHFVELLLTECKASNAGVLFVSHDQRLAGHFDRHVRFESLNLAGALACPVSAQ